MKYIHQPVLTDEVIKFLAEVDDNVIVDGTIGEGGHSDRILQEIGPELLIGIDRDKNILQKSAERLKKYNNFKLINADFGDLSDILERENIGRVSGILLDLGLSMYQIRNDRLGLSFNSDVKLGMSFDTSKGPDAWTIINKYSVDRIAEVLWAYGEEKWAYKIARAITRERARNKIETSRQLADLIKRSVPGGKGRIHPSTRTFQALRIAANDELGALNRFLSALPGLLKPGGRVVIISYHSLEDRIVKYKFREYSGRKLKVLTKKPIMPDYKAVRLNPACRSAKLRVAEKI